MSVSHNSWLPLSLLLLSACGASTADPTDTNTSWLIACGEDSDCTDGFSCLCGVCTVACEDDTTCRDISRSGVCHAVESACADAEQTCQRASAADVSPTTGESGEEAGHTETRATDGGTPVVTTDVATTEPPALTSEPPSDGVESTEARDAGGQVTGEPAQGPSCGELQCAFGDLCCDEASGSCVGDLSQCPAVLQPPDECLSFEDVGASIASNEYAGYVTFTQTFGGETKVAELTFTVDDEAAPFTRYGLPGQFLTALGYFGVWSTASDDFTGVYPERPLDPLFAAGGTGTVWANNIREADGPPNEITVEDSCVSGTATQVTWSYQARFAFADLVDYTTYAYTEPDAPIVTLDAVEHFGHYRGDTSIDVSTVATGLVDGELLELTVVGTLLRVNVDPE